VAAASLHLAHWTEDQSIPDRLPLLDRWLESRRAAQPLRGVTVLFIQHQLGNQVPQARAMLELGVAPEDFWWLDIPYTSNAAVRERLVALGIPRSNFFPGEYRTLQPYAPYQRKRTQAALRFLLRSTRGKLLVLDDGSYFLEAMSCQPEHPPDLAIVEQTTRGFIKIEENPAIRMVSEKVPLVNVARSAPKTVLEPPFIGRAVCDALGRRLGATWKPGPHERCLILGYGAIGRQVARFCRGLGYDPRNVTVHDALPDRVRLALDDGFPAWDRADLSTRFRLVIGCSGRASFLLDDYVFLEDGAVLGSASSGSVELSREDFIELADRSEKDDVWIEHDGLDESNVHCDLRFHFRDREARFLNAGFPLNFDGRVNCVPMHYIQPTPTMMVAAAVQAVAATGRGEQQLDPDFCAWLDREFRALLGEEADILTASTSGSGRRQAS